MNRALLSAVGIHISRWFAALAAGLLCMGQSAKASEKFESIEYDGAQFTVKRIDPAHAKLRVFLNDENGKPFHRFDPLNRALKAEGLRLSWAMNGGMYHGNFRPVGLCIINGKQISPLNFEDDDGNFFLKPNGVLAIQNGKGIVMETGAYHRGGFSPEWATQSGPMLLIDRKIHPRFLPDSKSKLHRNGVGITPSGELIFAITETPVNFHQFATFFRDKLGCTDALFLDGTISSLYSRELKRNDFRMNLGPIVGEVESSN